MSNITLDFGPALQAHREQDVETCLAEITPILQYVPHHPVALHLKAWAISKRGESEEALRILSNVISENPRLVPARAEYGSILMANSRHSEALQQLKQAHQLQPGRDAVVVKYCICLIKNHQSEEAEPLLRKLLKRSPGDISACFALAMALLQQGKWEEGFQHYRSRLQLDGIDKDMIQDEAKLWKGQSLRKKTILLQCEQGYGDQILFIRYAAWVKQTFSPGRIIVFAKPEMQALLTSAAGVDKVVTDVSGIEYDFHAPLLDLPMIHKTVPENIPFFEAPYLQADEALVGKWRSRFETGKELIAICWRTNLIADEHSQSIDHEKQVKSLHCADAEELCRQLRELFPAAELVSLQPGATAEEQAMLKRCGIADVWAHPFSEFAETAAIIENMDLIVSIDTGVAHLAGALGKPIWNLLPHYSDWRWSQDSEFSSWYPNMRLIRQGEENNWRSLDSGD